MKFRRLIILASSGLMLFGAACGGDSKDSSDAASSGESDATVTTPAAGDTSGAASEAGCDTLAKEDIEAAFGAGFGAIQDSSQSGTTICTSQRGEPLTIAQFTIKPTSAGEYDATIEYSKDSGAKATPVSGVGSKATRLTTVKSGITVIQVIAVKGSALFYITATAQDTPTAEKAEALAKTLAEKL